MFAFGGQAGLAPTRTRCRVVTPHRSFAGVSFVRPAAWRMLGSQRSPFEQRIKRRTHRLAPLGQSIFDLGRHLWINLAADNSFALKFAKLLDQHFLRSARN